jgi:molecular chaperone DnaJ
VLISFSQAALGAEIKVPTLKSTHNLKVPAGTQTDTTFRIQGAGIPHIKGYSRGDQIIVVQVKTPTKLTKRQEELLRELAEISGEEVLQKNKGFFQKYKKKK